MIGLLFWLGVACASAPSEGLEVHPMSRSSSRVDLEEGLVRWTLIVQGESIREVLPSLDLDADNQLSREEAELGAAEIEAYLRSHYGVRGAEDPSEEWVGALVRMGAPEDELEGAAATWIEAVWETEVAEDLTAVGVRMELFGPTSPDHVDVFELRNRGVLVYTALFTAGVPGSWIPEISVEHVGFMEWVWWGIRHILTGYDHLAFLLAILMCVRGPKHAVAVVTAFTAAHSITLAMAALEIVSVSQRFVELVIALSISFIALSAFAKEPRRRLWVEVGLFGLVHGLGFAGFLGAALSSEEQMISGLIGFNVGVELGQLAFLVPVGAALSLWRRGRTVPGGWWVPDGVRMTTSACVGIAGLYWFALRAGWIV